MSIIVPENYHKVRDTASKLIDNLKVNNSHLNLGMVYYCDDRKKSESTNKFIEIANRQRMVALKSIIACLSDKNCDNYDFIQTLIDEYDYLTKFIIAYLGFDIVDANSPSLETASIASFNRDKIKKLLHSLEDSSCYPKYSVSVYYLMMNMYDTLRDSIGENEDINNIVLLIESIRKGLKLILSDDV